MKKIYFFLVVAACISIGNIQAQTYSFTQTTGTYADLTSPTSINNGLTWDDPSYHIPVGFNFSYYGYQTDTISIDFGLGGLLVIDSGTTNFIGSFLVAYGADIVDRGFDQTVGSYNPGSLSPISYEVSGAVGSRILKVEWKNVGFYSELTDDDISTDFTNFQVWLYETTNNIEVHFGPSSITQPTLSYDGYSGSNLALVPQFDFFNETFVSNWYNLHGSINTPTFSTRTINDTLLYFNGTVANGKIFKFSPMAVGIEEVKNISKSANIYPNPVNNAIFFFENALPQEGSTVNIINANGQLVKSSAVVKNDIDVSALESGVYVIEYLSSDKLIRERFIKR